MGCIWLLKITCQVYTNRYYFNWYRTHTDSWVEQGGYLSNVGLYTREAAIILLIPYHSVHYNFVRCINKGYKANDPGTRWVVGFNERLLTQVNIYAEQEAYAVGNSWFASGY